MLSLIYLHNIFVNYLFQTFKESNMNTRKHPLMFNYAKNINNSEYLGSDGLPIEDTYNFYIKKCEEFKTKARNYAKDNLCIKNSTLHQSKFGYNTSQELEEDVFFERIKLMKNYTTNFNVTSFYEDLNSMYDCFSGKSKRIRIIRELQQERNEKFSCDFDKQKASWFTRYCILSRFIEAARSVILSNRLKGVLAILKTVTPKMIQEIEDETIEKEEYENGLIHLQKESDIKITPCICD